MSKLKSLVAFIFIILLAALAAGAQGKTTGSIKGKVRVEAGNASDVAVTVRQDEREIMKTATNAKGEFTINGLQPGLYAVTFRKPGLSVGTIKNVEVRAGKVRSLSDRLILTIDEGSIAKIRGSVFSADGRSVPGARVEIARIEQGGNLKKIDDRVTTETGVFVFRLAPERAKYRITVKANGAETTTKDIEVDDAVVYSVAVTLQPALK
jgi:hypothetical protein